MLKLLHNRYKTEIGIILDKMREALHLIPVNPELDVILNEVTDNPGKLLRPMLMMIIAGDCPEDERDELLATAAGMELIHNSSLVLDDMLDGAPVRRGKPTVLARYGSEVSLCVGDFILAAAYRYLQGLSYHASALEIVDVTQKACNGEMVQNLNRGNTGIDEAVYMEAIKGKTACLFRVVCESACRITHKTDEVTKVMGKVGEIIGIMFQLRDDLLDWTSSEEEIGKPVNEDFCDGIYTLPAIYAFSNPEFGEKLISIAERKEFSYEDLSTARELVERSGGIDYTKKQVHNFGERAKGLLDSIPDESGRSILLQIIRMLENS